MANRLLLLGAGANGPSTPPITAFGTVNHRWAPEDWVLDGSNILQWNDSVATKHFTVPGGSNPPTVRSAWLAGLDAAVGNGSNQRLTFVPEVFQATGSPWAMAMVVEDPTVGRTLWASSAKGDYFGGLDYSSPTNLGLTNYDRFKSPEISHLSTNVSLGNGVPLILVFGANAAGTYWCWANGVDVSFGAAAVADLRFGGIFQSNQAGWSNLTIGEINIWTAQDMQAHAAAMTASLNATWGIIQ